jgi:2-polyprenyl-3-methyl-5-hydroxy-6-metoxy-1,4-benzoquinol methylase
MLYRALKYIVEKQSDRWALQRFNLFLKLLKPEENNVILDLGGSDGRFFYKFQHLIMHLNLKIIVADIDEQALNIAKNRGFETLMLDETGMLNLQDKSVDIVFCNSVIEHVTIPKKNIWKCLDDNFFKTESLKRQKVFAEEIKRVGKSYFVQTPHIDFIIESHTWLPFFAHLKRKYLIKLLKFINKFWIKKTSPDWHLLNEEQMAFLFDENINVVVSKVFGFKKEIIIFNKV